MRRRIEWRALVVNMAAWLVVVVLMAVVAACWTWADREQAKQKQVRQEQSHTAPNPWRAP